MTKGRHDFALLVGVRIDSVRELPAKDPPSRYAGSITRTGFALGQCRPVAQSAATTLTACTTPQTGGTRFPTACEPWCAPDNDPLPRLRPAEFEKPVKRTPSRVTFKT